MVYHGLPFGAHFKSETILEDIIEKMEDEWAEKGYTFQREELMRNAVSNCQSV